jgi:glucose-6-phosphate 1-dehydrogenase
LDICSSVELKENTVIVVLGASGDLAKKKTFPALFGLVSNVIYRLHASLV